MVFASNLLTKFAFYICLFGVILFTSTEQVHADVSLSFGLYSSDKPTSLVKKFRPILNSLEKTLSTDLQTQVSIKLSITKTYESGITALVNGEVDFARFGPASYVMASEKNPDISLLAMETKNGKKQFKGIICVHKNSTIKTVAGFKGKRFAFGDKRSTIGRYLSQQYLMERGIKARDLAAYDYLDRHDKVGYAVAQGKYDAGALKESTFKKLVKKGLPLREFASFDNVTKPWVARAGLDKKIRNALQKALLNLKDKKVLKAIKKDGFTAATNEDYAPIRHSISINKAFFSK